MCRNSWMALVCGPVLAQRYLSQWDKKRPLANMLMLTSTSDANTNLSDHCYWRIILLVLYWRIILVCLVLFCVCLLSRPFFLSLSTTESIWCSHSISLSLSLFHRFFIILVRLNQFERASHINLSKTMNKKNDTNLLGTWMAWNFVGSENYFALYCKYWHWFGKPLTRLLLVS